MPAYFTRSVLLDCSAEAVYDFHLHPVNAAKVMPPGFTILSIDSPSHPVEGDQITLRLLIFGLVKQTWVVRWKTLQPPIASGSTGEVRGLLVDETLRGPFPLFIHEHQVKGQGERTLLTDHITFAPPFRPLGWVLLPGFYVQFIAIFWWRHLRTRKVLNQN